MKGNINGIIRENWWFGSAQSEVAFCAVVGEGTCDLVRAQFAVENKRVTEDKVNHIAVGRDQSERIVHGLLSQGSERALGLRPGWNEVKTDLKSSTFTNHRAVPVANQPCLRPEQQGRKA